MRSPACPSSVMEDWFIRRSRRWILGASIGMAMVWPNAEATAQGQILDVPAIAGQSMHEVVRVLGEPSERITTKSALGELPTLRYADGVIEIDFVDGMADWITIHQPVPMRRESLRSLNLPVRTPTVHKRLVMRWDNYAIPGIRELSIFRDYVFVVVATRPQ